jgi:polysaccharide deacetylase 2 family uncharacterized protein YibQ
MARRNPSHRPRRRKSSRKRTSSKTGLTKALAGVAILIGLVVVAGWLLHSLNVPTRISPPIPSPKSVSKRPPPVAKKPTYEIYPKEELPSEVQPIKPVMPLPEKPLPRVAIIIDDMGYDRSMAEKFLDLDAVLTFSILPHSPLQKRIAYAAQKKGVEILLHLPMEPLEYPKVDPGPGTLLTTMTPDELIRQLEEDIDAVPFAKGVNNHMGSRLTAESSQLYQVFSVLKQKGLFFIDSRTTAESVARPSARLFQIPFAQRDVFLDNSQDAESIRGQIRQLIAIANRNGQAVGIAHPHRITYNVLREMLPELKENVQLVPASSVVAIIG